MKNQNVLIWEWSNIDELNKAIESSWTYFVWLLLNNSQEKNKIIEALLKNSKYKTDIVTLNEDWSRIQENILPVLTNNVAEKIYQSLINLTGGDYNDYFNMLGWYKLWLDLEGYLDNIWKKERLYALLLISYIYKNNPELKDEKFQLIIDNSCEDFDIYYLHSILHDFFSRTSDYDFLKNCRFIIIDNKKWKEATKYLHNNNTWSSTKDHILTHSKYVIA